MSRRGAYAAVLACGAVVAAGLVVAASGPPVPVLARPASTETRTALPTTTLLTTTPPPVPTAPPTSIEPTTPSVLWGLAIQVLVALTAVVALAVLAQIIWSLARRPRVVRRDEPTFTTPGLPDDLVASAREASRLLLEGEPRNAIVAAWLALEGAAADTGLPRDPAETSTEYTARVLATWDVDPDRLDDLAALYREARFSVHPLGESHRRRAVEDLESLEVGLVEAARRTGSAERPEGVGTDGR